jgi:hypothetical protein
LFTRFTRVERHAFGPTVSGHIVINRAGWVAFEPRGRAEPDAAMAGDQPAQIEPVRQ